MRLWNFVHRLFFITRNLHTYELLAIVIAILMTIAVIIHLIRQKKRKEDFEDELREIENRKTASDHHEAPGTEGDKA